MNVNLGIWDKLSRIVLLLLLVAWVLGVFLWYRPLIDQNQRFRKKILELEVKVAEQERFNKQLRAAQEAMNDPRTLERLAREKLGYARTNETVIRFEAPSAAIPPRR